jgi:hypothetical protein
MRRFLFTRFSLFRKPNYWNFHHLETSQSNSFFFKLRFKYHSWETTEDEQGNNFPITQAPKDESNDNLLNNFQFSLVSWQRESQTRWHNRDKRASFPVTRKWMFLLMYPHTFALKTSAHEWCDVEHEKRITLRDWFPRWVADFVAIMLVVCFWKSSRFKA